MTEPHDNDLRGKIARRSFLSSGVKAGASIAVVSALPTFARAQSSAERLAYPFTLGVASGDPLPDAVVIWTRLAPQPFEPFGGLAGRGVAVYWQVARDERFRRVERWGVAWASPERSNRRGYVSVVAGEGTWQSFYRVVPFVATEGAPLETRGSFVVEDGDPIAKVL